MRTITLDVPSIEHRTHSYRQYFIVWLTSIERADAAALLPLDLPLLDEAMFAGKIGAVISALITRGKFWSNLFSKEAYKPFDFETANKIARRMIPAIKHDYSLMFNERTLYRNPFMNKFEPRPLVRVDTNFGGC